MLYVLIVHMPSEMVQIRKQLQTFSKSLAAWIDVFGFQEFEATLNRDT